MSYKAPPYTLQPGQRVTVQVMGREVAVIEADKDFLIATNDGEPEFITAGLQLSPEGGFHNIVMRNPHPEAINVRLGITDGAIKDNRASVSTVLPVRDPTDLSSFSDVIAQAASDRAALLAMMQNENDKRSSLKTFSASHANGVGSAGVVMLVDPIVNTAGLRVSFARVQGYTNSIGLYAGTSGPSSVSDVGKLRVVYAGAANMADALNDLYVPSGNGIWVAANGTDCSFILNYEVLP